MRLKTVCPLALLVLALMGGPAMAQGIHVNQVESTTTPPPPVLTLPAPGAVPTAGPAVYDPNRDTHLKAGIREVDPRFVARKYYLGPQDTLSIHMLNEPTMGGDQLKVQPDGRLLLDMIGPIDVTGLTMDDLYDTLMRKYRYYYRDPKLTISLVESKPFLLYISGAVYRPGSFEIATNVVTKNSQQVNNPEININRWSPLVSNILVAAGGLRPEADAQHVKVVNSISKEEYTVDLMSLLEGQSATRPVNAEGVVNDLYMVQGDTIYVPSRKILQPFNDPVYKTVAASTLAPVTVPVKVYGYVINPGLFNLNSSQSLTLLGAIAAASGWGNNQAVYPPKRVYLSRPDPVTGELTTIAVDPKVSDIALVANDIIYVPEKIRPRIGLFFDYMTRLTQPIFYSVNAFRSGTGRYILPNAF